MSYKLVSKSATIGTSLTDLYTCNGDNALVIGLSLTNNLSSNIEVTALLYSDAGGTSTDIIAPSSVLEPGETVVPVGGLHKIVMNPNDIIRVQCNNNVGLDAICSAMELNDYTS